MATAQDSGGSVREGLLCLRSSDGETYEVDRLALSSASPFLEGLLADCSQAEAIPLESVTGKELGRVVEFCTRRHEYAQRRARWEDGAESGGLTAEAQVVRKEEEAWERGFMALDTDELYDLMLAANFLAIQPLMKFCFSAVREAVKGKTPEEIRRHFGIRNDLTPEEEEAIRRQNQTLFR
uniref:SKP1-like protein n=1 Tax=Tetraselmis chuii TaxID=63592 RepID=A0A7S1T0B5_9CHLO|mmetsp:Transcript_37944/g.68033  ORF Transcript_37944/g.68033 Transcript_37944/m.68033 type:complete len:181 (+) Transcript_37944:209-751(+)